MKSAVNELLKPQKNDYDQGDAGCRIDLLGPERKGYRKKTLSVSRHGKDPQEKPNAKNRRP